MNTLDARLLSALRAASVHLPAEDLAGQLDATPDGVRARLGELRGAGFVIDERPALGFRLVSAPDRLIGDDLASRLGSCALAREIVVFEETDSTNEAVLKRGRLGAADGLVIFAERQTAGRGRFGRRWESASHQGLWFSLLMRPELPVAQWTRLTTWAAVSVATAIEGCTGLRASIKWPNDVYVAGRKVAGMLIESGTDGSGRQFAAVGVGVNVNQDAADFSPELAEKAGSLRTAAGRLLDRTALAAVILRELESQLGGVGTAFADLVAEAGARSFLLGRWVQFRTGSELIEGMAEQLDENGHLLLRGADGSLDRLTAGEVTLIGSR